MANVLKFFIDGDTEGGEKALKKFDTQVQDATTSVEKWGLAIGAAVATLSIKEATEFETKIAEVSTLLEDTAGLDAMEQAVKDLAIQYGQFPDEQVESTYAIISAGAEDAAEAMQTLEAANRLAIGGVTDVAVAADGLTSIMNAYGEGAGTATDVTDSLFVAMKAGKTTIGELSSSIGLVADTASTAGISLDETLAAIAALTKTGQKTTVVTAGLRQVIASIIKPSSEAATEAKKLGLEFNSTALKTQGLQGFLETMIEKTDGNTDSLTQLFGGMEALGPILALTGGQADSFTEILEKMNSKAGATDKAFGKMDQTSGQTFKKLAALGNVAAITLGNELLPAVVDLANFLVGPTTSGVNRVEDAFFSLKAGAFAAMGGVADSIAFLLGPLSAVETTLSRISGAEREELIFTSLADDIKLFSAAMEDGAIETFKARDAAEVYNVELRKKSDLLRTVEVETKKVEKAEKEATETTIKSAETIGDAAQKVLDTQQEKLNKLQMMAENAIFDEEQREFLRHERLIEQIETEKELLINKDILNEERKRDFDEREALAETIHQENLNNIRKDGDDKSNEFAKLSTAKKVQLTVDSGLAILAAASSGNKQIFELHKNLSLANAAISLPSAVIQSFENAGGYPWGIVPAAAMAVAGATQIAAISGTSFQAHDGLTFPRSGTVTGNVERGEMILNKGNSEGITKLAEEGLNGGNRQSLTLIVNINSPMFNPDWDDVAENMIMPALDRNFKRDVFLEGVNYNV